jgi:hypothetical protein
MRWDELLSWWKNYPSLSSFPQAVVKGWLRSAARDFVHCQELCVVDTTRHSTDLILGVGTRVSKVTRQQTGQRVIAAKLQTTKYFCPLQNVPTSAGDTESPTQTLPDTFPGNLKLQRHRVHISSQLSADFKSQWNCTPNSLCAFHAYKATTSTLPSAGMKYVKLWKAFVSRRRLWAGFQTWAYHIL